MLAIIDNATFKKEVLESSIPVVVDFYADWCSPCRMYGPIFEKVANKFQGKVKFAKANVDNIIEISKEYGIMSIPLTMLFKNGKSIANISGAIAEADLEKWIENKL